MFPASRCGLRLSRHSCVADPTNRMTGIQEPKQPGNAQRRLLLFQTFASMIPLLAINVCDPCPQRAQPGGDEIPSELIER